MRRPEKRLARTRRSDVLVEQQAAREADQLDEQPGPEDRARTEGERERLFRDHDGGCGRTRHRSRSHHAETLLRMTGPPSYPRWSTQPGVFPCPGSSDAGTWGSVEGLGRRSVQRVEKGGDQGTPILSRGTRFHSAEHERVCQGRVRRRAPGPPGEESRREGAETVRSTY